MAGAALWGSFRGLLFFYSQFEGELIFHGHVITGMSVGDLPVLIDNEHRGDAIYFESVRHFPFGIQHNGEVQLLRSGEIRGVFGVFVNADGENLEVAGSTMV